jgi:hypothetical protein
MNDDCFPPLPCSLVETAKAALDAITAATPTRDFQGVSAPFKVSDEVYTTGGNWRRIVQLLSDLATKTSATGQSPRRTTSRVRRQATCVLRARSRTTASTTRRIPMSDITYKWDRQTTECIDHGALIARLVEELRPYAHAVYREVIDEEQESDAWFDDTPWKGLVEPVFTGMEKLLGVGIDWTQSPDLPRVGGYYVYEQATWHGVPLTVVLTWHYFPDPGLARDWASYIDPDNADLELYVPKDRLAALEAANAQQ